MSADDPERGEPAAPSSGPPPADEPKQERPPGNPTRRSRLRGVARKLLDEPGPGLTMKEAMGALLDGSDKAKSEAIRMVGREVRNYLEGLGMAEGVHHLLTHYSLDVSASFKLKPLADAMGPGEKAEAPVTEEGSEPEG